MFDGTAPWYPDLLMALIGGATSVVLFARTKRFARRLYQRFGRKAAPPAGSSWWHAGPSEALNAWVIRALALYTAVVASVFLSSALAKLFGLV